MKTLYPSVKSLFSFCLVLFTAGALSAQDGDYARLDRVTAASASVSPAEIVMSPVIKVRARTDNKILLTWAPVQGAVSHYILERSTDGREFREAGLLFTGNQEQEPAYEFTDVFRKPYAGPIMYRLRVVGADMSEMFTPPTILKATAASAPVCK